MFSKRISQMGRSLSKGATTDKAQPPVPPVPVASTTIPASVSSHQLIAAAAEARDHASAFLKSDQMKLVASFIEAKGFIPKDLIAGEVAWFYNNLGIEEQYFKLETIESIARNIFSIYSAKIVAFIKDETTLDINLSRETQNGALFMQSVPNTTSTRSDNCELTIDAKYLDTSSRAQSFRLESYRSQSSVASNSFSTHVNSYFLYRCKFPEPRDASGEFSSLEEICDPYFYEHATEQTLACYESIMRQVLKRTGVVIEALDVPASPEKRLVIGFKQGTTRQYFSALSNLYSFYGLVSGRKFVEQFSNGITVMSIYLSRAPGSNAAPLDHSIHQVVKEASLLYCLPTTPFQGHFQRGTLSVQESIYGYIGWIFAQHFLNRLGGEFTSLQSVLNPKNADHNEVLSKLKKRLRTDTFTRAYILEVIQQYPDLVKLLYVSFAMVHYINPSQNSLSPSLSFQRMQVTPVLSEQELLDTIRKTVTNTQEYMIFESYVTFNKHVLKTNFYQPTKCAISFRMDPKFLPQLEYPTPLFGMFFVVGSEFRGFHLRFRDIARGGIRIVKSRNAEAYSINLRSLFDENYNLANTQQRKNKDIPEGGSKGTILLNPDTQGNPQFAFEKYVDAILDVVVVGGRDVQDSIVDLYGQQEILFFGPDEGTADYMDWAALHAKKRGVSSWKAFTTGKSQSMGGIPHDIYGMTTRSVHQYVLGIYEKLGLDEKTITKMQTGGPDGDLGSNEILISGDKTVGIVDGSGVLYDPAGIDRSELERLATERKMVNHFDCARLSAAGFRVLVDDTNVNLPDGTVVHSGLKFRNEFHLNSLASADLFVPCGGRPEAIDVGNVHTLLNPDGSARFKYIVEGANLFITQEARLKLEAAGVILFKDASANKGGVTSSSLEVLAALAFSDAEFSEHMQVKDGVVPAFYAEYVQSVQQFIEKAARMEFETLWTEGIKSGIPRSILSDSLSLGIVKLNEELQQTTLWDNVPLRKLILTEAFPKLLIDKLGLDTLLERVPESYVRAIFGCFLASRFVYKYGASPSQFAFFEFLAPYFAQIEEQQVLV
ncbi:NAD-dependent glutamate dehydrogenase [Chytriomyces hyalinus]|nr:NAD-dependent glutamate dehydrogenase [Chytriomyces hyalinus]